MWRQERVVRVTQEQQVIHLSKSLGSDRTAEAAGCKHMLGPDCEGLVSHRQLRSGGASVGSGEQTASFRGDGTGTVLRENSSCCRESKSG